MTTAMVSQVRHRSQKPFFLILAVIATVVVSASTLVQSAAAAGERGNKVGTATSLNPRRRVPPAVGTAATAGGRGTSGDGGGAGGRRFRSAAGASASCRCAPDQWEGVLRTVEREFDLTGRAHSAAAASHLAATAATNGGQSASYGRDAHNDEQVLEEIDVEMAATGRQKEDRSQQQQQQQAFAGAAEMESSTAVFYDFTTRQFATVDLGTGLKILANYNTGVQYVIGPAGCRTVPIRQNMRRMCLPEGAVLEGKYWVGRDQQVTMWKYVGPNGSTLRTTVSTRFCLPINEETFTVSEDGYASVTSSLYVNVTVGLAAGRRAVFDVPAECGPVADTDSPDRGPPSRPPSSRRHRADEEVE